MADEITYQVQFSYTKNGRTLLDSPGTITSDAAGDGLASGIILATHAAALAVPLGLVASPGLAVFRNLDDTNYIELGYDSSGFVAVMKIQPLQTVLVSLDGLMAAPYVKAHTADALMSYTIAEQ